MENLNIQGLKKSIDPPCIVKARVQDTNRLLFISFESNPPADPDGDLDIVGTSPIKKKIRVFSSPLEITYDKATVNSLISLFKPPEDTDLANLQLQAMSKLKEYRESSTLSLQHVIDNHDLMDVDISLRSSYFILPHSGTFTENGACAVVNLGKFFQLLPFVFLHAGERMKCASSSSFVANTFLQPGQHQNLGQIYLS